MCVCVCVCVEPTTEPFASCTHIAAPSASPPETAATPAAARVRPDHPSTKPRAHPAASADESPSIPQRPCLPPSSNPPHCTHTPNPHIHTPAPPGLRAARPAPPSAPPAPPPPPRCASGCPPVRRRGVVGFGLWRGGAGGSLRRSTPLRAGPSAARPRARPPACRRPPARPLPCGHCPPPPPIPPLTCCDRCMRM